MNRTVRLLLVLHLAALLACRALVARERDVTAASGQSKEPAADQPSSKKPAAGQNPAGQSKGRSSRDATTTRSFRFEYGARVTGLPAGSRVRMWLPAPRTSDHQAVTVLERDVPVSLTTSIEPTYGNKMFYLEISGPASGALELAIAYRIRRREVRGLAASASASRLDREQRRLFLSANRKVPLAGKQLELLFGVADNAGSSPLRLARALYDRVDEHVRYDKSRPGYGNGDVLWVCDSRFGNCTDFHSLFISLARASGLPARFEIGFPLPAARGRGTVAGYHCWALFYVDGRGWVPVDISEADRNPAWKDYYFGNLTENRVTFTTGRDIELRPRQAGPPLNFFVYPYVEVDDRPWPGERMELSFAYRDAPLSPP